MTSPEVPDTVRDAFDAAFTACARSHGNQPMVCCPQAGLDAAYPLIAAQVRADVDAEIATAVGRLTEQGRAAWGTHPSAVPYCGHELHGADGGACPGCGFDPYRLSSEEKTDA